MSISDHLLTALRRVQAVAPGRLGIHSRNRTIPHIVDGFRIDGDKLVPIVSVISGELDKTVTTAARFSPDILAWTGSAHVEGLQGSSQYMSVLIDRRDPNRTVASAVPFERDEQERTVTMGDRSVPVKHAPPAVAESLIKALRVKEDPEGALDRAHRIGILVYGHGPYGYLIPKYDGRGWSRLKNGSFFNAVGPFDELMHRIRGLSILTSPENFRDAMNKGAQ